MNNKNVLTRLLKISLRADFLYVYTIVGLLVPNIIMCFTERMTSLEDVTSCLSVAAVYALFMTFPRRIGTAIWSLFPIIFLCAFNLVLLSIFDRGPIAVDMYLNLLSTNAGEAGEVLNNILPVLVAIVILYIPLLTFASISIKTNVSLAANRRKTLRRNSISALCLSAIMLAVCHIRVSSYRELDSIFPVNAIYNLFLAVERTAQIDNYHETSRNFKFDSRSEHEKECREVYVIVIGETARSINFGINGYSRNTTPHLLNTEGVISFTKAYSQSNTTHKSVPMLLSGVSAENFNDIIYQRSIISAFKEAGFHTVFISCQKPNHSYIDFFGQEADESLYINGDDVDSGKQPTDYDCLPLLEKAIENSGNKLLVVIHTYGSHYNYHERYGEADAVFMPDQPSEARAENVKSLVNAYDNTIIMTDKLLHSIIAQLQTSNVVGGMFYVSDHGENLYDDVRHRFLHASPLPSWYELHVPMVMWLSQKYRYRYPEVWNAIVANCDSVVQTSESFFNSVLDIAGIYTLKRDTSLSVANKSYHVKARLYLDDRNNAVDYDELGMDSLDLTHLNLY